MKSSSQKKKDIDLLVVDTKDLKAFPSGFSIKSKLGQPSTLLNASQATNFVFKLRGFQGDLTKINSIKNSKKIKERLEASISNCQSLLFDKTNSLILENNLKKIDTNLPKIIAEMLLSYFYKGNKTLSDITADLCNGDLCKQLDLAYDDLKYIFTKFLIAIALGMFPKSEWNGYYEADGCIVLKQTGDIVCLHILEKKDLGEYLFKNTYLDTPSSTRHKFGEIYKVDDEYFFNLNLQIRFNN
jgi:type II restriction enzyme